MRIFVDIDGTICEGDYGVGVEHPTNEQYLQAVPIIPMMSKLREWIENGHEVTLYTARHSSARLVTQIWLQQNGIDLRRISLIMDKIPYDISIDDRAINPLLNNEEVMGMK
jgi:uncharacterized HAD superfamily protein